MPQKFNPDKVMLADSLGREVSNQGFTNEFISQLASTSQVMQLGQRVDMGNQHIKEVSDGVGELSDAYFVDEGQKIGVANLKGNEYELRAKKIGVILPVTEEFLEYTWTDYFRQVVPLIVDKFNKKIDGAAFFGGEDTPFGNPFGTSVYEEAVAAGNVVQGDINAESIIDLEAVTERQPNAFVGHRVLTRDLRRLNGAIAPQAGQVETVPFSAPVSPTAAGTLDGLPYHQLQLVNGAEYPKGVLLTGNFDSLKYGVPQGTSLRLKVADEATLSGVQNAGPDSGDVNLFEQDMQALRAIFEIAVAVPKSSDFAVLQPEQDTVDNGGDVENGGDTENGGGLGESLGE